MSIKKKLGIAIVAIAIVILLGSFFSLSNHNITKGDKEIAIKIINEITNETLYDEKIHTDALTLDALLKEQTELKAGIETSSYGGLLTSLMDETQDMEKGPWWLYTSDNNKVCLAQSVCPVIDQVTLMDQDAFIFTYTSDLNF